MKKVSYAHKDAPKGPRYWQDAAGADGLPMWAVNSRSESDGGPLEAAPTDSPSALDVQEGGNHYKDCPIQPVEYIHANGIGYFEGNVIKYVTRWRAKGGVEDLKKARHYIDMLIEFEWKPDSGVREPSQESPVQAKLDRVVEIIEQYDAHLNNEDHPHGAQAPTGDDFNAVCNRIMSEIYRG